MIFLLKAPFLVDFPACKAVWWHLPSSGRWISCWKPQGTSSCIWGLTKISGGWWKLSCETSMVRSGTDNDSINIQWIFNDHPKILMVSTCDLWFFRFSKFHPADPHLGGWFQWPICFGWGETTRQQPPRRECKAIPVSPRKLKSGFTD